MDNIILVGMPGCGKSTIGVILAKSLAYDFMDSDLLIQNRVGKKLHEIIRDDGIAAFMELEDTVNAEIETDKTIIATGGSVVYCERAMKHFKDIGRVVYLKADKNELMRRISNFKTRGIVIPEGKSFSELYDERVPLYERYADITVASDEGTAEEVVERLCKLIEG